MTLCDIRYENRMEYAMAFTPKTGLSKSKYTSFCHCPRQIWLSTYHRELGVTDAGTLERFARGNVVGDLAMGLFGDFTEVTAYASDSTPESPKLDLPAMLELTRECIANKVENICEASFSFEGNYCAVDILHKTENGYAIYEVKSSSSYNAERYATYARDIAYQTYVLEKCGVNVTGAFLVHLNNQYVLQGELDIKGLFAIEDLSESVAAERAKVDEQVAAARKCLSQSEEPRIEVSENCNTPYQCDYWQHCMGPLPSPSVFDLYKGGKKGWELYRKGKRSLKDFAGEKLTAIQKMQVEGAIEGKSHIDPVGIKSFLGELHYPLYFFDFESIQPAVPEFQGTRPYQQICFQYSLHCLESEGAPLKHMEFLAESGEDPNRKIAESICKDIPKDACVLVYNDSFEKTRLGELADMFPDLADHLRNVRDSIKDLLVPFQKGYYYLPAMGKSFSIKSVLPALFPDDPELNYHNLEGDVHNGGEAQSIFPKIKDMPPEEAKRARESLLKYCGLDTFALVKVLEKLKEV